MDEKQIDEITEESKSGEPQSETSSDQEEEDIQH
jgi:hypothetical protein